MGRRKQALTEDRVARALLAFVRESEVPTRTEVWPLASAPPRELGTREAPGAWTIIRRFQAWATLLELVAQANLAEDPQRELERLLRERRRNQPGHRALAQAVSALLTFRI